MFILMAYSPETESDHKQQLYPQSLLFPPCNMRHFSPRQDSFEPLKALIHTAKPVISVSGSTMTRLSTADSRIFKRPFSFDGIDVQQLQERDNRVMPAFFA